MTPAEQLGMSEQGFLFLKYFLMWLGGMGMGVGFGHAIGVRRGRLLERLAASLTRLDDARAEHVKRKGLQ